jgi:hypothetical protein
VKTDVRGGKGVENGQSLHAFLQETVGKVAQDVMLLTNWEKTSQKLTTANFGSQKTTAYNRVAVAEGVQNCNKAKTVLFEKSRRFGCVFCRRPIHWCIQGHCSPWLRC